MACPFFLPTQPSEDIAWLHSGRLPLGAGWIGQCCAPGQKDAILTRDEIRDNCNLGYATSCQRLPAERLYDAVRLSVARDSGSRIVLWFVQELGHRPAGHTTLEYDTTTASWTVLHPEPRFQRMAECYIQSYLHKKTASQEPSYTSKPISNTNANAPEN